MLWNKVCFLQGKFLRHKFKLLLSPFMWQVIR